MGVAYWSLAGGGSQYLLPPRGGGGGGPEFRRKSAVYARLTLGLVVRGRCVRRAGQPEDKDSKVPKIAS